MMFPFRAWPITGGAPVLQLPSRLRRPIRPLYLNAVARRIENEEPVDAADFVLGVPFDGVPVGFDFLRRGVNVGHPEAEVALARLLAFADDQMQVDVADTVPAAGEVEGLGARRLGEAEDG